MLALAIFSQILYYDFTILLDMCQYICIYVDSQRGMSGVLLEEELCKSSMEKSILRLLRWWRC